MTSKLPKRSADIYKEIESFEDYEYTNCIAYEMAIRNGDFKNIINLLKNKINLNNDFYIDYKLEEIEKIKEFGLWSEPLYFYLKKYKLFSGKIENILSFDEENCFSSEDNIVNKEFINSNNLDTFFLENLVTIEFSRPILSLEKVEVSLKLNISLPKDEIIAYISKIKDEYDKENLIIKTPLELLGEDLKKIDKNPLLNDRTKKIPKDKVADMFFIYDCLKEDSKKSYILRELDYYYDKYERYTYDTLNKYHDIAKDYIDNFKYKELITGVKSY